jgi:topoisomerase-4 subunit A
MTEEENQDNNQTEDSQPEDSEELRGAAGPEDTSMPSGDEAQEPEDVNETLPEGEVIHEITAVSGMYQDWFLDYASYVILERAVPAIEDGLKPVQRRILHSMKEMDDGRFNKVANIIGQTMQYHPHGDAAIGDAIVNLGQKDLMIETQGNWGDVMTGDSAAAPRYIEARLSKFALEVAFNPQTTNWQVSYDGRKREPVTLPMKFPLLLAQGVEGIAVGLSTKVMPHNFIELINASIDVLRGKKTDLMPDFPTGGYADFSQYNEGKKGGRIRCRARIEERDKRTLVIKDIPYGTTTNNLMESIVKANDNGKIKIKKVVDNTAKDVEIEVHLHPGTSPDLTIDALYAFTECELSIAPNACVIIEDKPHFLSVNEILRICTNNTLALLKRELEIKLAELQEKWHFSSLEKIFIEKRIYRKIEECETWEAVIEAIDTGLKPYKKLFRREVTRDDILRLTEIKIKRISKYDSFKADEAIRALEDEMKETAHHLEHLVDFAVNYFKNLLKKYGKGRERKTEIRTFDTINANVVAVANQKLYVNRKEGFIGYSLKKDEFVCDCSDIDDIIIFKSNGKCVVTKVSEKSFVGKDIIYVNVWKKNDERMIYNMIYMDGKSGIARAKRFAVTAITRDKEYDLTMGNAGSKVLYFSANPNSEAELVTVVLSPNSKAKQKLFDYDFATLDIKGRSSQGNILSKHSVRRVNFKEKGASTLGGRDIWYDKILGRLNVDKRGKYLGSFDMDDGILVVYKDGSYEITGFELTNRYEAENVVVLKKWDPDGIITAVHYDGNHKQHYVKRFVIETRTIGKKFNFIAEDKSSKLIVATTQSSPKIEVKTGKKKKEPDVNTYELSEFVDIRGWKALGAKLTENDVISIELLPSPEEGVSALEDDDYYADTEGDSEVADGSDGSAKAEKTHPVEKAVPAIEKEKVSQAVHGLKHQHSEKNLSKVWQSEEEEDFVPEPKIITVKVQKAEVSDTQSQTKEEGIASGLTYQKPEIKPLGAPKKEKPKKNNDVPDEQLKLF